MRSDYGYFEEQEIGKVYDTRLLKRLFPFVKPYRLILLGSIFLVLLLTGFNLSIPYITKVAIDRYIVPRTESMAAGFARSNEEVKRFLTVDFRNSAHRRIVEQYRELFTIEEEKARIPYDRLGEIERGDLARLRADDLAGIGLATLILVAVICLSCLLNFVHVMTLEYLGQMIMHDLRMRLFEHIQDLSIAFFTRHSVGRLVTRVTNDVQNMHEMFTSIFVFVFKDFFILSGIIVILLGLHWKIALATFTILPIIVFFSVQLAQLSRDAFRTLRIKVAEINSRFSETIGGIQILQLFVQEKKSTEDFERLNHENYLAAMKEVHVFAVFMPLIEMLGTVMLAIVIFYGGRGVISGDISLGILVAFISYIKMFFMPVRDLTEKYNILQNAMASAERIFMILDNRETISAGRSLPESVRFNETFLPPPPYLKTVESLAFENVSFEYVSGEAVLRDVCFDIQRGQTLALVGPTGSGKTSLINLIVRFYDPGAGRILINGNDIRDYDVKQLRAKTALVSQEPFLFSGTVRENILNGNPDLSENELERIIDRSNCRFVVENMADGIDTLLSENGASLSSGERQLISIARAFASDPELIIFDEATSYIDSGTELKIQQALVNLMANRTAIIIAHRLATARNADRIIVLNGGRICESGTHERLMARKGFYYKLQAAQRLQAPAAESVSKLP